MLGGWISEVVGVEGMGCVGREEEEGVQSERHYLSREYEGV